MTHRRTEKIDVYLLRPGCPPEHFREFLRTLTSKDEIDEVLQSLGIADPGEDRHLKSASESHADGGVVLEYQLHLSDGSIQRVVDRAERLDGPE